MQLDAAAVDQRLQQVVLELLGQLRWLGGLGIQTVLGWVVGMEQIRPLEIMGREVIPAAAELESAE